MFIQIEETGDPAMLRFLPGQTVLPEGNLDIRDRADAARSPLAARLFEVEGVAAVALGRDAITVTKSGGDWQHLKPALLGTIMDHFVSGAPTVAGPARTAGNAGPAEADGMAASVWTALRRVIDPELGYNIVDLGLVYGVAIADGEGASITMTTTTRGCPATDYLVGGAREAGRSAEGVERVEVELTYDPPWTPDMMSVEAKAHFGITD